MFGPWVLNEIWVRDMSSSKLFLFFERSLFKLRCETVVYIWAKLTVAFTCTSLPLNLYTSVFRCGCGFEFEEKFWRIDGFGVKKARIGGFVYSYSPPPLKVVMNFFSWWAFFPSVHGSDPIVITLYFFGGEGILSFICRARLRTDLYSHCSQLAIS